MKLSELIKKRRAELGLTWTDFEDAGIHCNTLSNLLNDKQGGIKPATQEKLALVLKVSQGEIQACVAEMNPLKKVVNKKSLAKQKPKKAKPEPEPEELPFDDLPEQEPEEGEDMKWFADIPKEEAPEKVKVKIQPEKKEEDGPYILPNEIVKLMPMPKEEDNVNHPAHYTQGGIECIEAIKASMTASEFRGYLKGNAMKYMWRYQLKNGVEDLRKAQWYLNRLIGEMAK
jgi:transcriptional regulator with XRE-family HTH domain